LGFDYERCTLVVFEIGIHRIGAAGTIYGIEKTIGMTSIKPIYEADFKAFFDLIDKNRKRLGKYFPNTTRKVATIEAAKKHLKGCDEKRKRKEQFLFGIFEADNFIGYVNIKNFDFEILKCEIGYFIDKGSQGRGLTTKVIQEAIQFCFKELKMEKIFLRIAKENTGSRRVAEKNGFELEGILRKEFRIPSGELIDTFYYGKLKENND